MEGKCPGSGGQLYQPPNLWYLIGLIFLPCNLPSPHMTHLIMQAKHPIFPLQISIYNIIVYFFFSFCFYLSFPLALVSIPNTIFHKMICTFTYRGRYMAHYY